MNTKKMSNLVRMIALFLTAVILVCTFGFTVDGWSIKDSATDAPPNTNYPSEDNTDVSQIPEEPEIIEPKFYNRLTGVETTEELANRTPVAFVMDKNAPGFGLSGAEIIVEIPTEEGQRLVCIRTDNDNLWKIGSIAPTRKYISNIAEYFGASLLSFGSDDIMNYDGCQISKTHYDFAASKDLYYTEYNNFVYTNSNLLYSVLNDQNTETDIPYAFAEGEEDILFEMSAKSVALADGTELVFDEESVTYIWYKNGEAKRDLINGQSINFANCLILFADSVIHDNSSGCQMIMNTVGSGTGYYITKGTFSEIKWSATANGAMTLFSADGEKLIINRGQTYINYVRSSQANKVTFA